MVLLYETRRPRPVSEDEEHMALGLATPEASETPTTLHTEGLNALVLALI